MKQPSKPDVDAIESKSRRIKQPTTTDVNTFEADLLNAVEAELHGLTSEVLLRTRTGTIAALRCLRHDRRKIAVFNIERVSEAIESGPEATESWPEAIGSIESLKSVVESGP